ncbi:hypothetical protein CHS0354_020696 [Potamilus streckersoni]|uniref:Uncharacterized protein n=1 Tax=Potamilus streckersoni TaxID=2493646 RepID=A0AAE0TFM1_9BIVA|nr:hypothetical protein CHS0354_020696 [Potamilus streckersoni]
MAAAKIEVEYRPSCSICLEQFKIPRQLPCAHSFCEKCLQSHITTEAKRHMKLRYISCPICRKSASPSIKDRPTSEWASLFPANTVLQSILPAKSKADRLCDACNTEGTTVPAEGFCIVCREAMCKICLKVHRKQKMSKDHTIICVGELTSNPEKVMKIAEGFTCSEHHGEDIEYYCTHHNIPCCANCFLQGHESCSKVIDLKEDLTALLCDIIPDEIIMDMMRIELHLKNFMEINDFFVNSIEIQVNTLIDQIREVRNKINLVLDELEKQVKTEGHRIYKEHVIRKKEENRHCLSLIHAVRSSHHLLEVVHNYGSNLQKCIMAGKMRSQLQSYSKLVREKYEETETIFDLLLPHPILSILSTSFSDLGKVVMLTRSNILPQICLQSPDKDYQVEENDVIDLNIPTVNIPYYSCVTLLSGDRVMLADFNNNQCILLSSSYQFITSHTLVFKPWIVCVLDDQEVAVSLYNLNNIQILSVIGVVITPVRTITTKHNLNGIASARKGDMVANGFCSNGKSQWSLITIRGDVKLTHQYDTPVNMNSYIALNNMKTRVYVSVPSTNSLLSFDMNGRNQFTYSPDNLRGTSGVAVDRYDNIYILGFTSNNIHQLSPWGFLMQVVDTGVPQFPLSICIHKSKDILIITSNSDKRKLHIYQLKKM